MNIPKISVIVPMYNAERWLGRCVDSILGQTFTDFELLLVDDGSSDSSGAICDRYAAADARVRVFHKPNGGASSARNEGLDNARGEWIAFADADDYVAPEWLQNYHVDENSDKAVVCQGLTKFLQNGDGSDDIKFIQEYRTIKDGDLCDVLTSIFLAGMLGWLHIKIFNGDAIRKRRTRFDVNQKYREDEKFLLDFLQPDDRLRLYDVTGYYYKVTETDKYADWKCTPEFARCTVDNIKRLGFKPGSIVRNCFVNEYKNVLLKYYNAEDKDRKQYFYDLVALVREEYDNIGIFRPTKFLLRYDKTGLLSQSALRLQLAIKGI